MPGSGGRGVAALTAAKLVSTTGSWTSTVAMPWLVLTSTGSAARMSLVLAAQVAGVVLLGVPGAAVVNRLGVRRTMLLGDAARAPLIALVPLLHHLDALAFPVLLGLAFAVGGCVGPYVAAQRLAIPDLVGEEPHRVARANSIVDGATRVGNLAGPALAGVLIGALGAANVLWFDALTFLVSFGIVLALVHPRPRTPGAAQSVPDRGERRALAGLRTMAADPVLRWMAVSLLCVGLTYPLIMVTLPVLTTTRYGGDPRTYGALVAATSVVATENTAAFAAYAGGGILLAAAGTRTTLLLIAAVGTGCAVALLIAVRAILRDGATPPVRAEQARTPAPAPAAAAEPGSAG